MSYWPKDASVFTIVKDVVIVFAALITAGVAYAGLQTWRRKLRGGTEYDLARRLLRAAYGTRNALQWVRSPYIAGPGFGETQLWDAIPSCSGDFRSVQLAYNSRWRHVQDAVTALQTEELEAETLWGQELVAVLQPLHACVLKLRSDLETFLWHFNPTIPTGLEACMKEAVKVVISTPDEEGRDVFTQELGAAVQGIEAYLRPYVRARRSLLLRVKHRAAPPKTQGTAEEARNDEEG